MKVAVAGTGTMGQLHLEALSKICDVTISGIVGRNDETLTRLENIYHAKKFRSIEELVDSVDVDLIDICLPTHLHYEYVAKAAKAGKHIICEKPLGLRLEEIERMKNICDENDVKLFAGHVLRFFPEYQDAREKILEEFVGKVGVVRLARRGPYPQGKDRWYENEEKSGGVILDLGIHDFDWLRWTFGEVERVMALRNTRTSENGEKIDCALVSLRFKNGVIGLVDVAWAINEFEMSFEVSGKDGMLAYNSRTSNPINVAMNTKASSQTGVAVPEQILLKSPLQLQLEHFIHCLKENEEPLVTVEDAFKSVEIALAAIKSAQTGLPVTISEERMS